MSDQAKKDAMQELIREGSASYLDALYALHRFKLAVTDSATTVLRTRLPDLINVVGINGPGPASVERYCDPESVAKEWGGNWAWVGARVLFPKPWQRYCYLGLTFDRDDAGNSETANVRFTCSSAQRAAYEKLKLAFRDQDRNGYYYDSATEPECGFTCILQDPQVLREEFEKMMEYGIDVWKRIGGWNQLLG